MPLALSSAQRDTWMKTLQARFQQNPQRHPDLTWEVVRARLESNPAKLSALHEMERTGGEPDLVSHASDADALFFYDCSAESPQGRRSLCYDEAARLARKQNPPAGSALALAAEMGVELLTETTYLQLQSRGTFDLKTSSWIYTPAEMRKLGGALFGDSRYGRVFFYHNGADSYYSSRGFRARLAF